MAKPGRKRKVVRKIDFHIRLKPEVIEFLQIGGKYHGVAFQTYLQWLLERALLDEIHYYGWGTIKPVTFDQQRIESEHKELLHLDRTRRRERAIRGPDDSSQT